MVRLLAPEYWDLGLAISVLFYSIGFVMFWFHYEFMRKERLPSRVLVITTTLITILALGIVGTANPQLINKDFALANSFLTFLLLSLISLPMSLQFSINEYLNYRNRQQFIESIGYLLLLIGATLFYITFINQFQPLLHVLTLFFASSSALTLSFAYMINPSYLYRIPFDVQHLFCFHDSGLTFYHTTLLRQDIERNQNAVAFLTGVFTATDAIVKNILAQQVQQASIYGKDHVIYFRRDPSKKIGVAVITTRLSKYLKQWMDVLLEKIPTELVHDANDPMTLKVDETELLEREMNAIVQQVFPYFKIIKPG